MKITIIGTVALATFYLLSGCLPSERSPSKSAQTRPKAPAKPTVPGGDVAAPTAAGPVAPGQVLNPGGSGTIGGGQGGEEINPKPPMNGGPPEPNGDPLVVKYMPGPMGTFLSSEQNSLGGAVDFTCPGDSVLVGEVSQFDPTTDPKAGDSLHDRVYQFMCQFMVDGQGVPLRRSSCTSSKILSGSKLAYSCPVNQYMVGQKSRYLASKKDRQYSYECCHLESQNGQKVVTNSAPKHPSEQGEKPELLCTSPEKGIAGGFANTAPGRVNLDINSRRGPLSYHCDSAAILRHSGGPTFDPSAGEFDEIPQAVLHRVGSKLTSSGNDRRHSMFCCSLKVES